MGLKDLLPDGADATTHTDDEAEAGRLKRLLLRSVDADELASLDPGRLKARYERLANELISTEGLVVGEEQRAALIREIVDQAIGLGPLEPLLADPTVTEIMVNGPDDIWVEREGRLQRDDKRRFANDEAIYHTIERIVSAVNRRVDESSPMVDARLPGGERVNIIIPPLSLRGPAMTIRRFPTPYTMAELVGREMLDQATAALLEGLVRARLNIIVSGGTGTGKTTFLNALSAHIPGSERIITIEDAAELQLQQPHVLGLEARPPNVEGTGAVTIRDLVRNSLRMRPDRIIVGEVRGGETLDMLQAMNTGHEGSLATVHANNPQDALLRLQTLAAMTELQLSNQVIRDQLNSAVDVIVQLRRDSDGTRRVAEVAAITSAHGERIDMARLVVHDDVDEGAPVLHHGLPDRLERRLRRVDAPVPAVFSGPVCAAADVARGPEVGA